jgi:2-amino-4-hydroxy-6-hydroxymethyldihydropteridine diphosphokinase
VACPPGSGDFLNAVVGIEPAAGLTPEQLLQDLQQLERGFGRAPKMVINEARPLDLDILAWGNLVRTSGGVLLPHPRAHRRRFVLAPWAEIDPEFTVPGQGRTVRQLLEQLKDQERCERVGPL